MDIADRMREAAIDFLDSLESRQREAATTEFDAPDHRDWTYLPGPRPGVALADLTAEQLKLAVALLDTGVSERGSRDVRAVAWVEAIRRGLPQTLSPVSTDEFADQNYWLRIFGDPSSSQPWGWRTNGHHLAIHATVAGSEVTVTPQFFGAEPATVLTGRHRGLRTLADETDLARDLLARFDSRQREAAIAAPIAPRDILTRFDPVADPAKLHGGLGYADMDPVQQRLLTRLVHQYIGRVTETAAQRAWRDITVAGVETIRFTWAGGEQPGQGHYYAVAGPTFLIEYDNTQDHANHIHSVWRDLRNDWGEDVLAAHYTTSRHHA